MSTKYILAGGYPNKSLDGGRAFFEEMVEGFKQPLNLLDCLFARPRETWDKVYTDDKKDFANHIKNIEINFQLSDPGNFTEQVRWADVIYLRGGETDKLIKLLRNNTGWEKELVGKTLAGTSAGANAISKYYYKLNGLEVGEGLCLLPIKIIVHFRSDYNSPNIDWVKAFEVLKSHKEELPIVTLAEGRFEVINR